MSLDALSIRQPWAWAVAKGIKPLENRSARLAEHARRRELGRHVAIHAGKAYDDQVGVRAFQGIIRRPEIAAEVLRVHGDEELTLSMMPRGAIVAVGRLVRVVFEADELRPLELPWWADAGGGLVFAEMVEIEPVPCAGQLGFWSVRNGLLELVRQRWHEAVGRAA